MNKQNIKDTFDILSETCYRKIISVSVSPEIKEVIDNNKKYFTKLRKLDIIVVEDNGKEFFTVDEEPPIFDENYNVINRIRKV